VEHGLVEQVAGLALFLFPGAAWTWALAPRMPLWKSVPLAVLLAFTLGPLALFALQVLVDLPLRLGTMATLAMALGLAGFAVRLRAPLLAAVAE
jgi:hypothetical protein